MKLEAVFVPHRHCTVTSGACFTIGSCQGNCSAVRKKDHETRIRELERRLVQVEIEMAQLRLTQSPQA